MATLILSLLLWILAIDTVVASGCMEIERNALLTFKAGLVDPQNLLSSWEGVDCCKWRGVVCSNITGHVVKLSLRGSYDILYGEWSCLSGEINPSLLLLSNLEHLDLSMNNFSENSIPPYLGSFKNLRYLNLSYLNFGGTIPPQIGNLSKLRYLDLSFDSTFSGITLRVDDILWLTRLSSLKYLDLSGVNLNTSTDWLHAVNMLPSLKVLHLADCSLPGISTSLSHFNLTTLNVLDLGGNQLQTLDDPSIYIGNPYLCGPPSTRNCSANEINYEDNEGPKDKFEWLWIYFGVVLGYLFGLAVFCGVLLLNNAWRNAYFSVIDIVCDKLCIVTKITLTTLRQRHRR
ncbi:probable LRR receptor-like serine/threonine-protein kinase At4g36180 [Ananas comosus]|uniref:Probable LRR receptor-like serine/threonine-protein kinase At4g36180 n=1 Tax=Ananas comosus TaxID=4615 RepID=A0A6P5EFQ8_ANACO|nr:probable LRR receptor-like serine/threonine-protein kinase At4g36180 [Ananas comosus]